MKSKRAKRIEKKDLIEVELENGAILKSKTEYLQQVPDGEMSVFPRAEFKNKVLPIVRIAMVRF
jgi:alkyl hydroperoxide reductase subunit F